MTTVRYPGMSTFQPQKIAGGSYKYQVDGFVAVPRYSLFPLDMLRYDCCYPVDGYSGIVLANDHEHGYVVQVRRLVESKIGPYGGMFTIDRWTSFGVTIWATREEAEAVTR